MSNIAHACPAFRWIRSLVYATGIVGYNRVCRLDYRFCVFNLISFVSGVSATVKAGAVVSFSFGRFGVSVRIVHPRLVARLMCLCSSDHIHWIDDVLIQALRLAPPSLSISIHIHVTNTPATIETLPQSYGRTDDVKPVRDDSRSEVVELQDGKAMETSNDSIFAIESVKLAHQRADLRAILRDEVTAATGRMSVSGQFLPSYAADYSNTDSVFSVWLAEHNSVCSWCS